MGHVRQEIGLLMVVMIALMSYGCTQRGPAQPQAESPEDYRTPETLLPKIEEEPLVDDSHEEDSVVDKLQGIWISFERSTLLYEDPDVVIEGTRGFDSVLPLAWLVGSKKMSFMRELYSKHPYRLDRFPLFTPGEWKMESTDSVQFQFYSERALKDFLKFFFEGCSPATHDTEFRSMAPVEFHIVKKDVEIMRELGVRSPRWSVLLKWASCENRFVPLPLQEKILED